MRLVDSHCHLQLDAFAEDRDEVLARSLAELGWLVVIGDCVASSEQAVAFVQPSVYATVGIHPHNAADAAVTAGAAKAGTVETTGADALTSLRALARRPGVVAIGEIGLDYHYMYAPKDAQRAALERQLELAAGLALPVVIHNRESHDDMTAILNACHTRLAGGVMHCFAGGPAFAEQCLAWGLHISFAGNVTFPKAADLREAAAVVPMDRLLVETDSPYLAPVPLRGKRCEPVFVRHTAEFLATLKNVPFEQFAHQTTQNAHRVFRIPTPDSPGPHTA